MQVSLTSRTRTVTRRYRQISGGNRHPWRQPYAGDDRDCVMGAFVGGAKVQQRPATPWPHSASQRSHVSFHHE